MTAERAERLRRLFSEAVERPAEERSQWLREACADDPALAEEIESLLAAYDARGAELERALHRLPRISDLASAPANDSAEAVDLTDQRVGHYHITDRLGGGGMGVVYKAWDERLERTVAIKVMAASTSADPRAEDRFIREARAASALDHPNIAVVHEIGHTEDGRLFIVMAHIEGESLDRRIARGPLPVPEAVEIATQVANGLARAHERGIIHRDIKPSNVMLSESGQVRIVDFGLAKRIGIDLTRPGTASGTAPYMSPEQVRGETVDRRTDIWALGVLLHEMITGQRPFQSQRMEGVLHAIVHDDPAPLTSLRSGIPLALEGIVLKALAKDPAARYQHVDEIPVDLRALDTRLDPGVQRTARLATPARPVRRIRWRPVALGAMVGLVVGSAAVSLWIALRSPPPPEPVPVRFAMTLPSDQQLSSWYHPLALSPDGRRLVYSATSQSTTRLYERVLDRIAVIPLAGTEGAHDPFFSPDGRWIGFVADGKLQKVPATGGIPQIICDAPESNGASWSRGDTIVLNLGVTSGLYTVSAAGGTPIPLTTPNLQAGEVGHMWPEVLPAEQGGGVLFTIWSGSGWRTAILSPATGKWQTVLEGGAAAIFLPTGHLLYAQMSTGLTAPGLLAVRFDPSRGKVLGTPAAVLPYPGLSGPNFAVSLNGTLAYVASGSAWARRDTDSLVWIAAQRSGMPALPGTGYYSAPRFSPDGRRLAVSDYSDTGSVDIWVYDLERGTRRRLTTRGAINNYPAWTPDGEHIAFNSTRSPPGIYWKRADGVGTAVQMVARTRQPQIPGSWSPDGSILAFTEDDPGAGGDIWLLPAGGTPRPFLASEHDEQSPRFSPDGRYVAYVSDASGQNEVYVRPLSGSGSPLQVSTHGGWEPAWPAGGRTLYFRRDSTVMAVQIETDPELTAGQPRTVLQGDYERDSWGQANFDVAADGRFVLVVHRQRSRPTTLRIVTHFFAQLRGALAGGG